MRIFEIDDEAEAGVGGAAQDVGGLRDDILGFDGLPSSLVSASAFLKPE